MQLNEVLINAAAVITYVILSITSLSIPIYLGIIKYYKQENIIETWNYIAIVFFSALIILALGTCIKGRHASAMCLILPIMLYIPLFILYLIHVTLKKMKDRGYHDKIITSLMILLMVIYLAWPAFAFIVLPIIRRIFK